MMSTEVLNLMQRRQAIERGLQQYFDGTMLERVLGHWEQQYSEKPAFVLNRFLSEICTTEELRYYRKDMLRQVLYELSELEKQELMQGRQIKKQERAEEALISGEITDAFSQFLAYILQAVSAKDLDDFEQEIKQHLAGNEVAMHLNERISAPEFAVQQPVSSYASIITAVYEIFCEFYGPMRADQVYARTRLKIKTQFPEVDLHQLL